MHYIINSSLTPNVMNVVQSTDLRKESSKCFIVILPVINGTGPVIAPFYHRPWFQRVRPNFVNMVVFPRFDIGPVTKCQKILQMSGSH